MVNGRVPLKLWLDVMSPLHMFDFFALLFGGHVFTFRYICVSCVAMCLCVWHGPRA